MRIENRKDEGEDEKKPSQPAGKFGQHIRRLCTKKILRYAATERCAQALAFRPLHQNDEGHEERDQGVNPKEKIDQNGHEDGEYRQSGSFVNGWSSRGE